MDSMTLITDGVRPEAWLAEVAFSTHNAKRFLDRCTLAARRKIAKRWGVRAEPEKPKRKMSAAARKRIGNGGHLRLCVNAGMAVYVRFACKTLQRWQSQTRVLHFESPEVILSLTSDLAFSSG